MTDKDYMKWQQKRFYSQHKQYKVYLTCDEDADIIKILDQSDNRSALIRRAILQYLRGAENGK